MAVTFASLIGVSGCKSKQQQNVVAANPKPASISDKAKNSLNWAGTYSGTLPCADCSGIETKISLFSDSTYQMRQQYTGKAKEFEEKGHFKWVLPNEIIAVVDAKGDISGHFYVQENQLTLLDSEGKPIETKHNLILNKLNNPLFEKNWKLVELNGKPIGNSRAFIVFNPLNNKVNGNMGCNSFFGSYELIGNNGIKFSQMTSTKMMCIDENQAIENELSQIINTIDNYAITDNKLTFSRAKMSPLAVFAFEK